MISICVADHTGHIWLSGFDQAGFLIFGHSADEMMMLKEASEKVYDTAIQKAIGQEYDFTCHTRAFPHDVSTNFTAITLLKDMLADLLKAGTHSRLCHNRNSCQAKLQEAYTTFLAPYSGGRENAVSGLLGPLQETN